MVQTTQNSKIIRATAEAIYHAFSNPKALEVWLAPDDMTGKVHDFDFKVGGEYQMSLFMLIVKQHREGNVRERCRFDHGMKNPRQPKE